LATLLQDVRVDHGRGHVRVAEQVLDGPNIRPALQQMGGKRVAARFDIMLHLIDKSGFDIT
jgi:hypothetical protein